jgi:anhydro-N-acetylmuramic acid kinase
MKSKKVSKYRVIGLMSGTSLDGVDIAYCKFALKNKAWRFSIAAAQTFSYADRWQKRLSSAHLLSAGELLQMHAQYGKFVGQLCNQFIKQKKIKKVDLIASHGHTIFHQPKNNLTFQLADGNSIHATTGLPVAFDFRSLDVALGGEGAPLVPIGDKYLFSDFDICLNLGGIANLSTDIHGKRMAFDICFCNMILNYLSAKAGKDFDKNGTLASKGSINHKLLSSLEKIYHANQKTKPSLGREGFEKEFQSILDNESIPLHDRLRTACESIASEIARSIPDSNKKMKLLATGGGALNVFLIDLLKSKLSSKTKVVIPPKTIINFKEALVFGFLGVLCLRKENNVLKSVTGASHNSCSGVLIG